LAMFSQTSSSLWCTGLSGGAPDNVWCPGCPGGELAALGKSEGAAAIIHRTIRCAPDFPVSQRRPRPTVVCAINGRHVAEPTVRWSHRTIRYAPNTVRCANGTKDPTVGLARKGRRSGTRQKLFMSDGAPDCPVHHLTEGKNCLPI
jgi:hypothetical protein